MQRTFVFWGVRIVRCQSIDGIPNRVRIYAVVQPIKECAFQGAFVETANIRLSLVLKRLNNNQFVSVGIYVSDIILFGDGIGDDEVIIVIALNPMSVRINGVFSRYIERILAEEAFLQLVCHLHHLVIQRSSYFAAYQGAGDPSNDGRRESASRCATEK
ncbi:hypothetical protein [Rhizobium ruizarguesonis]|uniref:hypothetical protein n=1 Tax=Rhizobium ruizarguesonis TaxID=2081791 RepID=UPI0013D66C01|nr:hypothetical protein [Rhizobium ruizarguesonis]